MKMITKIAFRNLLRNKRRSLIVLTSIVVGVVGLFLLDSIGKSMIDRMLENQILNYVTEMQIHKKGYNDDKTIDMAIRDTEKIEKALKESGFILHYSFRFESNGLLSSPASSAGIVINGIESEKEEEMLVLDEIIKEGEYLTGKSGEVLLGAKLAEKLEVGIGDKVVAVANEADGSVANRLFRVTGIFKSNTGPFDKTNIFVNIDDARDMLSVPGGVTSVAMMCSNEDHEIDEFKSELEERLGAEYEVFSYKDMLPLVMTMIKSYESMIWIIYLIFILAVFFGVVNTMLMSVYERIQEIGVLKSIGMKNGKIFKMILSEAFILGLCGMAVGMVVSLILYVPLSKYGIDLAAFSDSLDSFGVGTKLYATLDPGVMLRSLVLMPLGTMLGAVYPALKAIRLQPTDAMRYY